MGNEVSGSPQGIQSEVVHRTPGALESKPQPKLEHKQDSTTSYLAELASGLAGGILSVALDYSGAAETDDGYIASLDAVMRTSNIQPWRAEERIRIKLQKQQALFATSLSKINVELGLVHFRDHMKSYFSALGPLAPSGMRPDAFIEAAKSLCAHVHQPVPTDEILREIYDSMDYDMDQRLSIGEWACGIKHFFRGTPENKERAIFSLLDTSGDKKLNRAELKEYLSPIIKAMVPTDAAPLRPLLLSRLLEQIFFAVDVDTDGSISIDEFLNWNAENDVIKVVAKMIEGPVYKVWLRKNLGHSPFEVSESVGMSA